MSGSEIIPYGFLIQTVKGLNMKNTSYLFFVFLFSIVNSIQLQAQIQLDDRDNYAQLANSHFKKGEWVEGKKVVDEGLIEYPKDSDLRMLLGKYYFQNNEYEKARFELVKSLEYNKNNVEAKQILVNVEIETKRYSSAICYINELLEVNPYWKGLWKKKMEVYRLEGNHTEANRLLKRISQIYPEDGDIKEDYLYYIEQEARTNKNEGKLNKSIELTTTLIEQAPRNEEYYLELINNYLKAGDYEKALVATERGLYNIPGSTKLIDKKTDILSEQNRYDEVLSFINQKMKEGRNTVHLQQKYNYFVESAARHYRATDPYTLYKILLDRNPDNEEAFNYVVNTATANGLFDDALDAIKALKAKRGETKNLLAKELFVYERMGNQGKINQTKVRLYQLYSEDEDIKEQYTLYRLEQAKSDMSDGLFEKAINHWRFIAEYGDEDLVKTALISIHNCAFQVGKYDEALIVLERLKQEYPDELEWSAKIAVIYGKQEKYQKALNEYERVLRLADPLDKDRLLEGYDELATTCVKQLVEDYRLVDAIQLIDHWLRVNPKSEQGVKYAINVSAQMNNYSKMEEYALIGLDKRPGDIYFQAKLAESYNLQKKYRQSLDVAVSGVVKNPYHKDLVATYSQSSEDYARYLIKQLKPHEGLAVLDSALVYDPQNKSLKYWKGVAYEKIHENDSAYLYQSFYEPALMELKDFSRHLKYLKNKTYKNKVGLYYLRSRFSDKDVISSIATLEYIRMEKDDTYAGRINYAGRQNGKGVQGQVEWTHNWKPDIYTRIDAAASNKIFSKFMLNGSAFKLFKNEWEGELGLGYRRMADDNDMFNVIVGGAKEWNLWWLNSRFNSLILDGEWYYSLSTQARYHLGNPRSYLTVMGSIGSAPDADVIDNQLYDGFSVTNSMLGMGIYHLINDIFSVGVLGTWHNYEDKMYKYEEGEGQYRNLYNLYIQLHVSF